MSFDGNGRNGNAKAFPYLSVCCLSVKGCRRQCILPLTERVFSFTLRRTKDKKDCFPFLLCSILLFLPIPRRKRHSFRNLIKALYTSHSPRYKLNPVVSYSFHVRKIFMNRLYQKRIQISTDCSRTKTIINRIVFIKYRFFSYSSRRYTVGEKRKALGQTPRAFERLLFLYLYIAKRTYYCHLRKKRGEQQNKKVCATVCAGVIAERFSGDTPRRRAFFVRSAVALLLCLGRVLVLGARERSERVTTRRQPPRQRSRRTCIKTVTHFYGCIQ